MAGPSGVACRLGPRLAHGNRTDRWQPHGRRGAAQQDRERSTRSSGAERRSSSDSIACRAPATLTTASDTDGRGRSISTTGSPSARAASSFAAALPPRRCCGRGRRRCRAAVEQPPLACEGERPAPAQARRRSSGSAAGGSMPRTTNCIAGTAELRHGPGTERGEDPLGTELPQRRDRRRQISHMVPPVARPRPPGRPLQPKVAAADRAPPLRGPDR